MFAPPQLIQTEVFAALPQSLRKTHVPAERIAAGGGGIPAGSFLEGPSFDRAGNLYVVEIHALPLTPLASRIYICE